MNTPTLETPSSGPRTASSLTRHLAIDFAFLLFLAAFGAWRFGAVQSLTVSSINMAPTLAPGERVIVRGYGGEPQRGDVVVYRSPFEDGRLQVGRIVATEGNRVELGSDGLNLDGQSVAIAPSQVEAADCNSGPGAAHAGESEACLVPTPEEADFCKGDACLVGAEAIGDHRYFTRRAGALTALLFPLRIVPEGHVFVLSDNRADERDSRIYGSIPRTAIVGVASFVYYASDETGIRWDRIRRKVS